MVFVGVPRAGAATVTISIRDFFFEPATVTAAPGDTIAFHNDGTATHQVVASDGSFDSGALAPGDSYFVTMGTSPITYVCDIHASMTGSIVLQAGGGTTATTVVANSTGSTAPPTTDPALATTGAETPVLALVALSVLAIGAGALAGARRQLARVPALAGSSDHLLPARDRDRRGRVRRPPAEL
jgi:plastocyanin